MISFLVQRRKKDEKRSLRLACGRGPLIANSPKTSTCPINCCNLPTDESPLGSITKETCCDKFRNLLHPKYTEVLQQGTLVARLLGIQAYCINIYQYLNVPCGTENCPPRIRAEHQVPRAGNVVPLYAWAEAHIRFAMGNQQCSQEAMQAISLFKEAYESARSKRADQKKIIHPSCCEVLIIFICNSGSNTHLRELPWRNW